MAKTKGPKPNGQNHKRNIIGQDEAKSEIKIIKDTADFIEKDEQKIYHKLEAENKKLKL